MNQGKSDNSFGQTAVGLGYITDAQVQECVQVQAKLREMGLDEPLGEILVKKGYITALQNQNILKKLGVHTSPIPGYTIQGKIGQGGMGTVYKANQTSVNRTVAIKILAQTATKDKTYIARFLQEAQAAAALSHKNLIAAIDVGESSGMYYFVMEYVVGKSCRELLNAQGPFEEKKLLDVAAQMAEVLDHIHQHKIVHRDIKPENILMTPEGVVKLCDLGLAKSTSSMEQSLTQTGLTVGTPYFMSPEQVRGDKDVDIRADLYSLGATLYYLASGRYPYEGKSAAETMSMHLTRPVPDPKKAAPTLSDDTSAVIQKLMAKDRAHRYQTPSELLEDVRKIKIGSAPHHARQHMARAHLLHKAHTHTRMATRKRPNAWPVAAAAAAAVVVTGIVLVSVGGSAPPEPGRPVPAPRPVEAAAAPAPPREAPKDPADRLAEASRLFASAEQLSRDEKWKEARADLVRLKDQFAALLFTQSKSVEIGKMIAACDRRIQAALEVEKERIDKAHVAFREERWADALLLYQELVRAGHPEFQKNADECKQEIAAEAVLQEATKASDEARWGDVLARIADLVRGHSKTHTVGRHGDRLKAMAERSRKEQGAADQFAKARAALDASRWADLAAAINEIEKYRETSAYRAREAELQNFRAKLAEGNRQEVEAMAASAWVKAGQRYGELLAEKKYDEAQDELREFTLRYTGTKVFDLRRAEIDAKLEDARKRKLRAREDEAKALIASLPKDFKAGSFDTVLENCNRLLGEFGDLQPVKSADRTIKSHKAACEDRSRIAGLVLVEMDFEDYPGQWSPKGGAVANNTTDEVHQGRRSARISLPSDSRVHHPIQGMTAKADTITFWARSRAKAQVAPVEFTLNEEGPMNNWYYSVELSFGPDWKMHTIKISELRLMSSEASKNPKRPIDPTRVGSFTLCPADSYSGAGQPLEIQFDSLRVETKK